MSVSILDLAAGIHFNDLLETDDTSVPKIIAWLLARNGELNDLIGTSYEINGNDYSPQLGADEAGILANMYLMHYYQRQQKTNLNATQYDWSEISEGDSTVRRVSKNEVSKSYRLLANDIRDYLYKLVNYYKAHRCIPASIHSEYFTSIIKILQQP